MRKFNFLSKSSSQSCGHSSVTLASTVGSPSAHRRSTMLRLLSVLVLILTIGVGQMWGAEYEIVFQTANSDSNTELGAAPAVSDVVSSGASYVASFSSCSKIYVGTDGVKLGSSKATGTINFTLATNYQENIKSIKIVSAQYGTDSGKLTLYSGSTSLKDNITPGQDATHTFTTATTVSSIKITTSSKRAYITKIVITTEEQQQCTNAITISKTTPSNGSFSVHQETATGTEVTFSGNPLTGTVENCGTGTTTLVVVPSPANGYEVDAVTATNRTTNAALTPDANGNYACLYTQGGNVSTTITVTFKEKPKYTVSFSTGAGNDAVSSKTETTGGAGIDLPEGPTPACSADGWTFAGWAAEAVASEITTAPTLYTAGTNYKPSEDVTLYAVYSKGEYVKITTIDGLVSGAKYLIVANSGGKNYIMKSSSSDYSKSGDDYVMASAQVDETTDGKYSAASVNSNWRYTINKENSDYFICDVVNSGTSIYADIAYENWWGHTKDADDPYKLTVEDGVWSIDNHYYYQSSYHDVYLGLDDSSKKFKSFSSTQPIFLYKETISYLSAPTCAEKYDVTIATDIENGEVSADATLAEAGATITLTATPDGCYEFQAWDVHQTESPYATVTVTSNQFTMPEYDVTVSATFTHKAAGKKVNFDAGPGVVTDASLTEECDGAGITLPSVTASGVCKGWTTFAGWSKTEVDSATTNFTPLASPYVPENDNETLYAVYSKVKGGSGFTLSINDGENDIYVGAKVSGQNYLAAVSNFANAVVFQYEEGGYLSYDASGTKTYISSSSDNTTLTIGTTKPSVTWTESGTSTYTYQSSGTGQRYLGYNYNNGNTPRFSSYGSNFSHEFTKHSNSTTYYCSDPNCCTPHAITCATGLVGGSVSANKTEACAGEAVTLTATPTSPYTGGVIKVVETGSNPENDITSTYFSEGVLTMPNFAVTVSATFTAPANPTVNVDKTSLDFETPQKGASVSAKTFTVTGSALTAGTLTISAPTGFTVSPASINVAAGTLSAQTITVTPSTATAGTFDGNISIEGAGLSSAVTVGVTMTVKDVYAITWKVAGVALSGDALTGVTTQVVEGNGITALPEAPANNRLSSCSNKFMGWSFTNIGSTGSDAPELLFTAKEGAPAITKDTTFYAVFATETQTGSGSTTILYEPFTGYSTAPSAPGTNATVFEGSSMTYNCTPGTNSNDNNKSTNLQTTNGPDEGNNILIRNTNGAFTINNIPTNGKSTATLTYKWRGSGTLAVIGSENIIVGDATTDADNNNNRTCNRTITINSGSTYSLTFKNTATGSDKNLRLDVPTITTSDASYSYSDYVTECCHQYTIDLAGETPGTLVGGTISADPNTACAGTEVTLTATPAANYVWSAWNVTKTGDALTTVTVEDNKFDMPAYDVTVSATFAAKVQTPTFSVADGTYNADQTVEIACATEGATIYYTTDGTTPTAIPANQYSEAISVNSDNTVIKAIAVKEGSLNSEIASATYHLQCATPTFGKDAGEYLGEQTDITIAGAEGTAIHYTIDGNDPDANSAIYSSALTVSATTTVKAIATKANYLPSEVASATYTIVPAYTVTWMNRGAELTTTRVAQGGTISAFPTKEKSGCGAYTHFYGWAEDEFDTPTASPTSSSTIKVYRDASELPVVNDDVTYYAVWANAVPGWVKASSVEAGDKVIIVNEEAKKEMSGFNVTETSTSSYATVSGYTTSPAGLYQLVVVNASTAGYVKFKTINNDYVTASNGNNLYRSGGIENNNQLWSLTFNNGDAIIHSLGQTTRYIRYNSGQPRFAGYESNTDNPYGKQNPVQLYKKSDVLCVTACDPTLATITYDGNGAETECESAFVHKGGSGTYDVCTTNPTRDYYEFAGWSMDAEHPLEGTTIAEADIDNDITLTALWTPVEYPITYNLNGGENAIANPATYNVESGEIVLAAPTKGNSRFDGWYKGNVLVTTIAAGSHENIVLDAEWTDRHEIVFDVNGETTTIYRADDENLETAVAGQGTKPTNPAAPTMCNEKVFVGWVGTPFDGDTDNEPADLTDATGTVNDNTHLYAVWAIANSEEGQVPLYNDAFEQVNNGTGYGNKGKLKTSTVFGTGTAGEARMSSGSAAGSIEVDLSDQTLESTITITFKLKRYGTETGTVTLSCMDEGSTASFGGSPFSYPTGDDNWHDYSSTVTGVNAATKSIHFTSTSSKRVYIKDIVVTQAGIVTTYSAYSMGCNLVVDETPLNVTENASLTSLTVKTDGEVSVATGKTLTVKDVTIQSTSGAFGEEGTSGQLLGSGTVNVNGNLYLEIKLCDGNDFVDENGILTSAASRKWYCISAPFDVAINGGFFWGDGTPMELNTHFQLFEWDGDRRATGASGWRRTSSNMKAHTAYFIGFDDARSNQNTIKLKAMSNTISNTNKIEAQGHGTSGDLANWNGLGNPNFHHIALDKNVQAFDYNEQAYSPYATGAYNFVVGTPFFIQYAGDIAVSAANGSNPYRAPQRESDLYSYCVRIGSAEASRADNQIYVRALETASAEFDNERDMITLNGTSSNYGALLWTENYGGKRLAIEEAPLVNGTASYVLTLSAPANGTYSISVAAAQENADLYLTYEGAIIWNLSMGAYTMDLNKGITNGYGLLLQAKAPNSATGVDEVTGDGLQVTGAQKVIIDEHVYILRGGQMYDVNGKMVK